MIIYTLLGKLNPVRSKCSENSLNELPLNCKPHYNLHYQ